MLVPVVVVFVALALVLLTVGVTTRNLRVLAGLSATLWVSSLVSALFVGWAWLERSYSENWAMIGFFFISLPIIATAGLMAVTMLVAVRRRRIEGTRTIQASLCLLLLFLLAQALVGFMSG